MDAAYNSFLTKVLLRVSVGDVDINKRILVNLYILKPLLIISETMYILFLTNF